MLSGDQMALLRRQTLRAALGPFKHMMDVTGVCLLVSNEGNFRNLQVELLSKDSAEECFSPGCWLQHCSNTDKQDASYYWGRTRSSSLREKISHSEKYWTELTEDLIQMHDCYKQTWFQLFWIFFCLNAGNLKTNHAWCQMILNGSSCIPAILLCVQLCTSWKRKHSCLCDCTHPNTILFWNLVIWTWSSLSPLFQDISDFKFKLAIEQSHSESKPDN